jgi:hypothetical protein
MSRCACVTIDLGDDEMALPGPVYICRLNGTLSLRVCYGFMFVCAALLGLETLGAFTHE